MIICIYYILHGFSSQEIALDKIRLRRPYFILITYMYLE